MAVEWKRLVFADEIENFVESTDITDIVKLTQDQYNALDPGPDANTLYLIVPAE